MTELRYLFCLALATAVISPAFAAPDLGTLTTQEECEKAGGDWDTDRNKCDPKEEEG